MAMNYPSVLIVDDDPVFRTTIEAFFTSHGTTDVVHACEGVEARAVVSQGRGFDLVILDLNMPELDGIEFLALLKDYKLATPLLVISSAADVTIRSAETLARAYGLNLIGSMSKPVDFEALRTLLNLTKRS